MLQRILLAVRRRLMVDGFGIIAAPALIFPPSKVLTQGLGQALAFLFPALFRRRRHLRCFALGHEACRST
jgi:hypothetical protein